MENSNDELPNTVQSFGAENQNVPRSAAAQGPKFVFAHFMVGNTYPYTIEDWVADIKLASEQEIDGFVLNVGREPWQRERSADCFIAAARLPEKTKFKLFFSFDMTSIPGNSWEDFQLIRNYFSAFANHPRSFRHPNSQAVVVSTFSGENSTFGRGSMEEGWNFVKHELSTIALVHLIPSFFINPARYATLSVIDGGFNWNGSWPIQLTPQMPRNEIVQPKLDSDQPYLQSLNGKTFMAALSPWFFTHYGPDSWNKNWIYRGDDWLFVRRWQQLIQMRDRIDIVQLISWNDYGESHYMGPIRGAQPNSQAWVDGYPHVGWLHLNRYFTRAYKNGKYPSVEKDQIFLWARPHPKDAIAPEHVPRPNNWQLTDDTLWAVVLATSTATVELRTDETTGHKFEVKAGMTMLSCPLSVGGGIHATMTRSDKIVANCYPLGYRFEGRPGVYNFNAFVAMSK